MLADNLLNINKILLYLTSKQQCYRKFAKKGSWQLNFEKNTRKAESDAFTKP